MQGVELFKDIIASRACDRIHDFGAILEAYNLDYIAEHKSRIHSTKPKHETVWCSTTRCRQDRAEECAVGGETTQTATKRRYIAGSREIVDMV